MPCHRMISHFHQFIFSTSLLTSVHCTWSWKIVDSKDLSTKLYHLHEIHVGILIFSYCLASKSKTNVKQVSALGSPLITITCNGHRKEVNFFSNYMNESKKKNKRYPSWKIFNLKLSPKLYRSLKNHLPSTFTNNYIHFLPSM